MREISESYRYIVRTPDVRGGNARLEGTRVAVHDVIVLLQNGETIDSLTATCLPMLTRAQVYECLAYYEDHRGELDLLVARQMTTISSEVPARLRGTRGSHLPAQQPVVKVCRRRDGRASGRPAPARVPFGERMRAFGVVNCAAGTSAVC